MEPFCGLKFRKRQEFRSSLKTMLSVLLQAYPSNTDEGFKARSESQKRGIRTVQRLGNLDDAVSAHERRLGRVPFFA